MAQGRDSRFAADRERMVEEQVVARGIRDPAVLAALRAVPREKFVPFDLQDEAYFDRPLPIGDGQTISQPFVVALMTTLAHIEPDAHVLEVGTGSGYAAAVLSRVAARVCTIERHDGLARDAARRLTALGFVNVRVRHGDGTIGWPEEAPFDAIIVAAGGPGIPDDLKRQLASNGRLVVPTGTHPNRQRLVVVTRGAAGFVVEEHEPVQFVPLIGRLGWDERDT